LGAGEVIAATNAFFTDSFFVEELIRSGREGFSDTVRRMGVMSY